MTMTRSPRAGSGAPLAPVNGVTLLRLNVSVVPTALVVGLSPHTPVNATRADENDTPVPVGVTVIALAGLGIGMRGRCPMNGSVRWGMRSGDVVHWTSTGVAAPGT